MFQFGNLASKVFFSTIVGKFVAKLFFSSSVGGAPNKFSYTLYMSSTVNSL